MAEMTVREGRGEAMRGTHVLGGDRPQEEKAPRNEGFPASYWQGLMIVTLLLGLAWINLSRVPVDASLLDQSIQAPKTGFLAPDFTLTSTDGETFTLSELRGTPVILNFWATWCPPCRAEMPAFEEVWQRYGRGDVLILGVNQGESATAVEGFARGYIQTSFPLLLDRRTEVGAIYGVRALPTTVFVDREGRIQDVKVGGPLDLATILDGVRKASKE